MSVEPAVLSAEDKKFRRVFPMYIEGTTLFGVSLDSLHSSTIDRDGLKEWAETFADLISVPLGETEEGDPVMFSDVFTDDLLDFCIYIAMSDGAISDREIECIDWLLNEEYDLDGSYAEYLAKNIEATGWAVDYPLSFKILVNAVGGQSRDVMAVSQVASFYKQVARFVYSVDNSGDFDKDSPVSGYVNAYMKYVERVSALGFLGPDGESSIEEVCKSWELLVKAEEERAHRDVCGSWKAISGNALSKNGLSDLILEPNGRGYMVKKKMFGTNKVEVTWDIQDVAGDHSPVVHIPSLDAHVLMRLIDSDRMMAIVFSSNSRLQKTMAMYQRM